MEPTPDANTSLDNREFTCPYCRLMGTVTKDVSCPNCGAPADVRLLESDNKWEELPGAKDRAVIQFSQSKVEVQGSFVPMAQFTMAAGEAVWFAQHKLCYADKAVSFESIQSMNGLTSKNLTGAYKQIVRATGPGHFALSDNVMGELIMLPLQTDQSIKVRNFCFVAASSNVTHDTIFHHRYMQRPKPGVPPQHNITYYENNPESKSPYRQAAEPNPQRVYFHIYQGETFMPMGGHEDVFTAKNGPGWVLIHSPGNTRFRDLAANESVLIHGSSLLYRDPSVQAHVVVEIPALSNDDLRDRSQIQVAAHGPGRIAVSTVFSPEAPLVRDVDRSVGYNEKTTQFFDWRLR